MRQGEVSVEKQLLCRQRCWTAVDAVGRASVDAAWGTFWERDHQRLMQVFANQAEY